jgi:hypothetical protein
MIFIDMVPLILTALRGGDEFGPKRGQFFGGKLLPKILVAQFHKQKISVLEPAHRQNPAPVITKPHEHRR